MHTLSFSCTPTPEGAVSVLLLLDGASPSSALLDVSGVLFGGGVDRASYDLYTCSCGVSGCAGFHEPLMQRRLAGQVIWTVPDEQLAQTLGANRLVFDQDAFDAARADLEAQLRAFEAQGRSAESLGRHDMDEDDNDITVYATLDETATWCAGYYAGQAALEVAMEAASDPHNPAPLRLVWDAYDEHGALNTPLHTFSTPAAELAVRLLNIGNCLTPHNADRGADIAPVAALLRAFAGDHDTAKAEAAFLPYRRHIAEDGVDTPGNAVFRLDDQGPLVCMP